MVYLINKETNEIIDKFENPTEWNERFVYYKFEKGSTKIYASEGEYFTDQAPEIKED